MIRSLSFNIQSISSESKRRVLQMKPRRFEKCLKYKPPKGAYGSPSPRRTICHNLINFYKEIGSDVFHFESVNAPKRVLTQPSTPALNRGKANKNGDLIVKISDVFQIESPQSPPTEYIVESLLGKGTYGQVFLCSHGRDKVAIKVIKSLPEYRKQAQLEAKILQDLNDQACANNHSIIRLFGVSEKEGHILLVFPRLSISLYDILSESEFVGLPFDSIREYSRRLLESMEYTHKRGIIHCDVKPENILVSPSSKDISFTIDYGSSCYNGKQTYHYLQSRFYRAPEVLLRLPYSFPIDIWSSGCLIAELYLGLPLLAGSCEYEQLRLIYEKCSIFPDWMLDQGGNTKEYFIKEKISPDSNITRWRLLSRPERIAKGLKSREPFPDYRPGRSVEQIIINYFIKKNRIMPTDEMDERLKPALIFADFIQKMLAVDPNLRATAMQCLNHPFLKQS